MSWLGTTQQVDGGVQEDDLSRVCKQLRADAVWSGPRAADQHQVYRKIRVFGSTLSIGGSREGVKAFSREIGR
eukprot:4396008-Amphidinium_carterae.1